MDLKNASEQVLTNPYLLEEILGNLDIRSLQKCSTVNKEFFDAVQYENAMRKDIEHILLSARDIERLNQLFLEYTELFMNLRPKNVLIFVGSYRDSLDYRRARHGLRKLRKHLPKQCAMTYIDVGNFNLVSNQSPSYDIDDELPDQHEGVQMRYSPSMSSLLFPDMDGIDIRVYTDFQQISTDSVKCVLYFEACKQGQQRHSADTQGSQLNELIRRLGSRVAFGGGCPKAIKLMDTSASIRDDRLRPYTLVTFGGRRVRASSVVLSEENESQYSSELTSFRNALEFDCDYDEQSKSFAFLFGNRDRICVPAFTHAFHSVFPFVLIYGFLSNKKMFGHFYPPLINDSIYTNRGVETRINANAKSVLVIVNFSLKRDA